MAAAKTHLFTSRSREKWILLLLWIHCILLLRCGTQATWMYLGVASLAGSVHDDKCNELPGLVQEQLQVCRENPESLLCISEGARRGILECQSQFKFERWNCTTQRNHTVFGPILTKGTRETAFIYAVLSAGVVHAVTQACSVGNLTDCSCDMSRYGESDVEGWKWGGCSDNVDYGLYVSKQFVDAPEVSQDHSDSRILMNLHNNEVGRESTHRLTSRPLVTLDTTGNSRSLSSCALEAPATRKWKAVPDGILQLARAITLPDPEWDIRNLI
ncbi:hypothetical protein RRG08_052486 [Elysia crispata]|uniref:Protein Wnt n=1 Tax=Elysia crispata TaxID=231223 RepID=A0AAE1B1J5_9GAST|nr:hypothetical protein RRG08_052486 [Elysia crispata]